MVSLRPMAGNAERQDEQKGRRALRKHLMEVVQGEGRGGTTPLTSRAATDPTSVLHVHPERRRSSIRCRDEGYDDAVLIQPLC